MKAMEIIDQHHWNNIWIETDSSLVVLAVKNSQKIPWTLRNRWDNALLILNSLNCIISHVYRKGNQVADSLANHGLTLNNFTFWYDVPDFASPSFIRDKAGWPSFRISS